ncbi:hypothetical protein ACLK1Y_03830 [Escherichia coli]
MPTRITDDDRRRRCVPNPDRLLEQATEAHRGKLKIFFGACAGVRKTRAMLAEAQRLRSQGLDILAGVVRRTGVRRPPRCSAVSLSCHQSAVPIVGATFIFEFDLDAALARRPALVLIDSCAHSNAPRLTPP